MTLDSPATATIFVELLNEGTPCWRPVAAELLDGERYRIVSQHDDDEEWAFATGDIVRCKKQEFSGGESGLVAFEKCS